MSSYEECDELVDLDDAADVFGYGGSHNPDVEYEKVGDLTDGIYEIGLNYDSQSDAYQQLRSDLPDAFKALTLEDLQKPENQEKYAAEIELTLDVANDVRNWASLPRPDSDY